jgi:hypothetical protein
VGRRRGQSKLKQPLYRLATPNLPISVRIVFVGIVARQHGLVKNTFTIRQVNLVSLQIYGAFGGIEAHGIIVYA